MSSDLCLSAPMMEKSDDPDHNGSLFSLDNNNAPRSFFRVLGLKEYHAIFCISCLIIKLDLLQFNLYLHDARERATCFLLKGTFFLLFLQSFKGLSRSTRNSAFYSFRTMHPEKRRALLKLSENEKKSAFNANLVRGLLQENSYKVFYWPSELFYEWNYHSRIFKVKWEYSSFEGKLRLLIVQVKITNYFK